MSTQLKKESSAREAKPRHATVTTDTELDTEVSSQQDDTFHISHQLDQNDAKSSAPQTVQDVMKYPPTLMP